MPSLWASSHSTGKKAGLRVAIFSAILIVGLEKSFRAMISGLFAGLKEAQKEASLVLGTPKRGNIRRAQRERTYVAPSCDSVEQIRYHFIPFDRVLSLVEKPNDLLLDALLEVATEEKRTDPSKWRGSRVRFRSSQHLPTCQRSCC